MSLWKIAWRSIQQRALSSWLTGFSMSLGVALVVIVLVINGITHEFFKASAQGYHLIVGAKGGKTQLVLNTVFHLSQPIENLPYKYYQEFAKQGGDYKALVEQAVPFCLGDTYQGFRVVGTIPALFDHNAYAWDDEGNPKLYSFGEGRNFRDALTVPPDQFDAAAFEAVIGSVAASQTGLEIGSKFEITHGIEGDHTHEEDQFTVVGILDPTGTPNDRAVFINMEGFYLLEGHALEPDAKSTSAAGDDEKHDDHGNRHEDHEGGEKHKHEDHEEPAKEIVERSHPEGEHEEEGHVPGADDHQGHAHDSGPRKPLPEDQREITAILVRVGGGDDIMAVLNSQTLSKQINEGRDAQAVAPIKEVDKLLSTFVAPTRWVLLALTVAIVIVACIGVMVSIYNSMNERTREIAIIRALGAGRETVMAIVLLESMMLALLGGLAGVLMGHFAIGLFSPFITSQIGVPIQWWHYDYYELIVVPVLIVLAAAAGFLPAFTAYRTDVAKALSSSP